MGSHHNEDEKAKLLLYIMIVGSSKSTNIQKKSLTVKFVPEYGYW
jgi:hypothetical protein